MEQTKLAIEEIAAFRAKLGSILTEEHLRNRCENVLLTLENGLRSMVDMPIVNAATGEAKAFEPTPITHVMGQEVTPRTAFKSSDVTPGNDDVNALRKEVEEAYKNFAARSNESILENLEDLTIRGVAMKAGVEVSSTYPTKVDGAFIDEIKAAILDKENVKLAAERTKQVDEAFNKFKAGYDALVKQYNQPEDLNDEAEANTKAAMLHALEIGIGINVEEALAEVEAKFIEVTTPREKATDDAPATEAKAEKKTTGKK